MKKRGFTLIELLAVIVILAVIALITIPIILNVVEKARKEAFRDTVYHVMEAVELDMVLNKRKLPFSYVVADNEFVPSISMKGKVSAYGEISVDENGNMKVLLDNGTWCAKKSESESRVQLESSPCLENPIIVGNLSVEPKWGEGLLVSSSAISKTSTIISYEFTIKKDNEIIGTYLSPTNQHLFSFENMSNNDHYQIEVVIKDDQGHQASTTTEYDLIYEPIVTRYLVVEVYDKLAGNGAAINELEFLDANNQKLTYTVNDGYDSFTKSVPFYWNSTMYWQKENLYDGQYSYSSNTDGGNTSTLFIFEATAQGEWARFLIDFGTETEIKTVNLWTGGDDRRQPHIIKMYRSSLDPDSTFSSTYIKNRGDSLPLVYEKEFSTVYTEPTEDTNYLVYPKDTEVPVIQDIHTNIELDTLSINADIVDPFYSSGIEQVNFALIKDDNKLSSNDITTWQTANNSTVSYDLSSLEDGTYYIYIEATDQAGNKAFKVSDAYQLQKTELNNQYMIMEVYDHFSSNGAVVTELEFYDDSNQKLSYNIPNVYDKIRNGIPYYWNSTIYWQKDNLYDGAYSYTSNTNGGTTSTLFNYISNANQGTWSRAIIDFGQETNIDHLKIWLGGPEGRLPKEVHFYVTDIKDTNTIYNQNIKVRNNTSLIEIAKFSFSANITAVTMFEKNDLKFYTFKKK